jgi:DeoR family transcriptional regulator, fructose operon transcriptional repressor
MPKRRRLEIVSIIQEKKTVTIKQLAEMFDTSYLTIRRDLEDLEKEGIVKKVHGGAILTKELELEPVFDINKDIAKEEKNRIALEASKRVQDNMAIIIGTGSTCLSVVKYLNDKKNIKVATASMPIAMELWKLNLNKKDIEISVCGGLFNPLSSDFIGPHAINFFHDININLAFIGATAFSINNGVSTATYFDAEITRAIVACSKEVIVLTDSSKFGLYSYVNVLPLNKISEIITDNGLNEDVVRKIKLTGVKITLV